jgi:hypothetical protein
MIPSTDAVVLSGGSAFGLAATDGVMARLEAAGVGFPVPGGTVPIVPGAVVFDLGRGGDFTARPEATTNRAPGKCSSVWVFCDFDNRIPPAQGHFFSVTTRVLQDHGEYRR